MAEHHFSGIWRSRYGYHSSTRKGEFEGEHYMRMVQKGNQVVAESLPKVNKSYMVVRFSLDGDILTGSWQENAEPEGYYKGTIYHGAMQLVADKTGKRLKGKWVGFGQNMEVNTGPWEIEYVGEKLPDGVHPVGLS